MKYVLVIDDSRFFCALIAKKITQSLNYKVVFATSYKEGKRLLESLPVEDIHACLVDFRLPDARKGEIVELVTRLEIPTIVLISDITKRIRRAIWRKQIVDYVIKSDKHITDYLIETLDRLRKNTEISIAIVDDSRSSSAILSKLLKVHKYKVLQFNDPEKALEQIKVDHSIKMLITDYDMPSMNGQELTKKVRQIYNKQELAILGISAKGQNLMAASFLKQGADDFIIKQNFLAEEFYIRVNEYINRLETFKKLKEAATKDYLTKINNRRYFFELAEKVHDNANRRKANVACAIIDIDHFKTINDQFGHHVGDEVLIAVAQFLNHYIRKSDILARFGGEEFCIYMSDINPSDAEIFFKGLVKEVSKLLLTIGEHTINVTISIGVNTTLFTDIDQMIEIADKQLYVAKESGRNQVILNNCQKLLEKQVKKQVEKHEIL